MGPRRRNRHRCGICDPRKSIMASYKAKLQELSVKERITIIEQRKTSTVSLKQGFNKDFFSQYIS
ncbi:unnamed protein product [Clavelina lepadiformis]|uniref:Uncharacterized protein n=1 Tax=Clavelina lepadiformis TaxID=159417 RepID=A0ABP0FDT8_CLALP